MKPIVAFPKGSITAKDKLALCKAGYVPIETDAEIRVAFPTELIGADKLAICALKALKSGSYDAPKAALVPLLLEAIEKQSRFDALKEGK